MNMRQLKKNVKAFSPVIATLMMVLVSVGAAGALYAWQIGWTDDATEDIGAGAKKTLSIDGSSTVYEFSVVAKELYEAANPDVKISVTYTGSGAGREAARKGYVDIGSASSDTDPDSYPVDLNRDGNEDLIGKLLVTTVARDGVTMCTNNIGGADDITKEELTALYLANLDLWTTGDIAAYTTFTPAAGDEYTVGDFSWTSTAGGATIGVGVRTSVSGTQEAFCSAATDIKSEVGRKQLNDITLGTEDVGGSGNSELMDAIEGASGPVLSFCSLTEVAASSVVNKLTFDGVEATEGNIADGSYGATRPLQYLTVDINEDGQLDPGVARDYIEFCLIPEVNEEICAEAGYTSLFA